MKVAPVLIVILFASCKEKQQTIKAVSRPITESVYACGIIKSKDQYNVYTKVSGIVQKVFVDENELVKIGTPLFQIVDNSQQLNEKNAQLLNTLNNIKQNKGKLQEAQSHIAVAKQKMDEDSLMLKRQQTLWDQAIGSKVELEQKKLTLTNSKMAYTSALQNYTDLEKQLVVSSQQAQNNWLLSKESKNDFVIRSAVNGRVFQVKTRTGELVSPQSALAVIGDAKQFIIELEVDEYDIVSVAPNMKVFVVLNSYKDEVFNARVTKINPIMNPQSKTFMVEAIFTEQPVVLYPAISCEANILIKSKQKALLIPRGYLKDDSIVLLATGKEKIVRTGMKDLEMIEIIAGLNSQDLIAMPKK